jgi:tetratricopeptide (TPR) repeat protein
MTADNPSALAIAAGGNLTPEIISDQNGKNSNKSRMPYRELSFFYPDGSIKHGHSWIYTHGARPNNYSKKVFGREKELGIIEKILKEKSALVITGHHGTGKSTLASMFVDRIGKDWKFPEIYWRKVDETTTISEVIGSFFTDIGKPVKDLEHYKIVDQINLLFHELNKASYLLVLDNFEILLDPQTNKLLESKIGFSELIEKANENHIKSKIIFISCDDFVSECGIRPFSYKIRGLDVSAGIQLLRREGLNKSEDELKRIIKFSGGHPVALILLAQLAKEMRGSLYALLNDSSLWVGKEWRIVINILHKVYSQRLSEDEQKILKYLSIFRKPVSAEAITVMANDPAWTESRVEEITWELCLKSLLQKTGENYWEDSLVSKYAGARLSEKVEYYKLASKYYLSCPLPAKPAKKEDFKFLIEAHHYACMAGELDQAFKIISDNNLEEYLDYWGNYTVLIDIYSKMLPEDGYGNEVYSRYIEAYGLILGNLGTAYRKLGDLRKAVDYSEQALKIIKESESRSIEGILLGNLGLSYRKLGDLEKAIECSEQALKVTKEVKDRSAEGIILGNLGLTYHDLGAFEKAIEYYEQALKVTKKTHNRNVEGILYGNMGLAYRKLGEFGKAIECSEQAAIIAKEIKNKREEVIQLGNMGRAYHIPGEFGKAIEYYGRALEAAKEVKNKGIERILLVNMGLAYHDSGELKESIENYEMALAITQEMENRIEEGILFGNLGRAYNDLGDPKRAIEYYQQAFKIAKEFENREEQGVQLGNLGRTYYKLRDPRKTIEHCEQALKIAKEMENRSEEGVLLGHLGRAYNDLNNSKKAIEYYEQALKIAKEEKNRSVEGTLRGNLGLAYRKIGEFRKAIDYYEQAFRIAKETEDRYSQGILLGNLGRVYHMLGEREKAVKYYEHSLSIGREIEDQNIINFFKKNLEELRYSKEQISHPGSKQNKLIEDTSKSNKIKLLK